jgi:hypothetical protein
MLESPHRKISRCRPLPVPGEAVAKSVGGDIVAIGIHAGRRNVDPGRGVRDPAKKSVKYAGSVPRNGGSPMRRVLGMMLGMTLLIAGLVAVFVGLWTLFTPGALSDRFLLAGAFMMTLGFFWVYEDTTELLRSRLTIGNRNRNTRSGNL